MIEFRKVSKSYKTHEVLKDIDLTFPDGVLTCIIGPSGCGKTTMLKMINRLIYPTSGAVYIDGQDVKEQDPVVMRRKIGYVIQNGGLFPHMTLRQNIELIENLEKKPKDSVMRKTVELMEMVDMDPHQYLDRYPSELSGGQQQRIGVARAFANDPEIILFDEPFSALDPITRNSLQDQLIEIQAHEAKTMVFVTHDMNEAIKIADRICIMHDGHVVQFDTPEKILRNPADDFVESFVGANRIWSSPEYIHVEDFMIRKPVTALESMTLGHCALRLRSRHVDTLPVVDHTGKLVGILDKRTFMHPHRNWVLAKDVMNAPDVKAHPEDNILQVLELIRDSTTNNIPVTDADGKLVGLLTSSNLLSTLSKQYVLDEEAEEPAGNHRADKTDSAVAPAGAGSAAGGTADPAEAAAGGTLTDPLRHILPDGESRSEAIAAGEIPQRGGERP